MQKKLLNAAVIVAALGYFVDVFDLLLFSVVRVPSLKELGLPPDEVLAQGSFILNLQLAGLIFGGFFFGILGDKIGRIKILFASILFYSLANIGCAFVHDTTVYAVLRFFAGVGLSGELGAGVTLVSELLPKDKRGIGTTIITGVGLLGAVAAGILSDHLHWRTCYIIGGVLGLLLLVVRIKISESTIFDEIKGKDVRRGDLVFFFSSWERVKRYLLCVGLGFPTMFTVYIFVTFSPELLRNIGVSDNASVGVAIMYAYISISIGDFLSGFVSQKLNSRISPLEYSLLFYTMTFAVLTFYGIHSMSEFYLYVAIMGFLSGIWALIVTIAAEQFGTNIRALAATSIPNVIRGSTIILIFLFQNLKAPLGFFYSTMCVGWVSIVVALLCLKRQKETFGKNLEFVE